MKIENYEKQIVRGTIRMLLDRGVILNEDEIEYMVSKYTGNMQCDHRYDMVEFIKKEIEKAVRG